jgi:hypothetical protein
MTRVIFATVGALVCLAFDPSQAVSVEAPWCAVTKDGDHWDCRYQSAAECQPNVVAGNRGWCNQNPYFVGMATKRHPASR